MKNTLIIITLLSLGACGVSFLEERFDKKCISSNPKEECEKEFVMKKGEMHFGPEPDTRPFLPVVPVEPIESTPVAEDIPTTDWWWQ